MIRGRYDEQGQPRVKATANLHSSSGQSDLDFLISTGTSVTMIPRATAQEMGWEQSGEPNARIAFRGIPIDCHRQWLDLTFTQDDGSTLTKTLRAAVADTSCWPAEIPPILGRDFLADLQAIFSPKHQSVEIFPNTNPDWRD